MATFALVFLGAACTDRITEPTAHPKARSPLIAPIDQMRNALARMRSLASQYGANNCRNYLYG